jgi:Bacterial Ig-like domain
MNTIKKYRWVFYALTLFAVVSCAVVGQPSGGEKDVEPPKALSAYPADRSTNFNTDKIEITFDEFVKLNQINQAAIFSPPLNHAVEYSLRGKTLVVEFEDTLKENTTYTIYFGDAIGDNHENNILKNFQYCFSTGSSVDSMQIKGFVKDAFSLKAPEDALYVMLYKSFNDSLPLKEKPFYIAKTDESGYFEINNIANASYKLFALKDMNSNLIYDQPNELIAFIQEPIKAEIALTPQKRDSTAFAADTSLTEADSVYYLPNNNFQDVFLFEEIDSTQRLIEYPRVNDKYMRFVFRFPVESLEMRFLNYDLAKWNRHEWNKMKDTLGLWLLLDNYPDTLLLEISDKGEVIDTAKLMFNIDNKKSLGRGTSKLEKITYNSNAKKSRKLPYFKDYNITFSQPIDTIYADKILLYSDLDTLSPNISFIDSLHRRIKIEYEWEQGENYEILIPDSSIFDIYGFTTDTIREKFRVTKEEDYSTLTLDLRAEERPYILQLINANQNVIAEQFIEQDAKYTFINLVPASYTFRLIEDDNENKRWDTGNYIKGILPERVYIYPENFDLKSNFEHEIEWAF